MKTKKVYGQPRTVKGVNVWITEHTRPECLKSESDVTFMQTITLSTHDMRSCGWTKVGVASITVELIDEKKLIDSKVESLQAQLAKDRADSEVRQNAILLQISKLQALEFDAS